MTCFEDRDLAARARDARDWITHDERGRMVGLVLLSLFLSIAMTVLVTAIVGTIGRRRPAPVAGPMPEAGQGGLEAPTGEAAAPPEPDPEALAAEEEAAASAGA